jgi:hypothetical protein
MSLSLLTGDASRWLNTLRLNGRVRVKHVPPAVMSELVEARLARITGGNLVITSAGLNGSPRYPAKTRNPFFLPTLH